MCVLAKTILTQTVFLVLSVSAFAASDETQFLATGGGPIEVGPLDSVDHEIDELHPINSSKSAGYGAEQHWHFAKRVTIGTRK